MDVTSVSAAIKAALETVVLSDGTRLTVYPFGPDTLTPPAAMVIPDPFPYHADFDGDVTATWTVRLFAASVQAQDGQELLYDLISTEGASSAYAALETLTNVQVQQMRGVNVVNLADGGTRYYTADIACEVLA